LELKKTVAEMLALRAAASPVRSQLRPGHRALSTKKPSNRKSNAKYTVQNVQASLHYLFEAPGQTISVVPGQRASDALKTGAVLPFPTKNPKPDTHEVVGFENGRKAADNLPIQGVAASERAGTGGEATIFKNQLTTVSYLFANNSNNNPKSGTQDAGNPPNSSRRRSRKRESSVQGAEFQTNDSLKHENVMRSMRFLFGINITST
jgi:hypothetical protein